MTDPRRRRWCHDKCSDEGGARGLPRWSGLASSPLICLFVEVGQEGRKKVEGEGRHSCTPWMEDSLTNLLAEPGRSRDDSFARPSGEAEPTDAE